MLTRFRGSLCRAPGPSGNHGIGSSTAVKQAPPNGVEAPAVAAPERQQHLADKAFSAMSLVEPPQTGRMNMPGLSGLTAGGTSGLSTVGLPSLFVAADIYCHKVLTFQLF